MKTITIGTHIIELNIGENLTVKEFRKIYPIIKGKADNEIEMVVEIVKALSNTENVETIIDTMTLEEFTTLSEEISKVIEQKKK